MQALRHSNQFRVRVCRGSRSEFRSTLCVVIELTFIGVVVGLGCLDPTCYYPLVGWDPLIC